MANMTTAAADMLKSARNTAVSAASRGGDFRCSAFLSGQGICQGDRQVRFQVLTMQHAVTVVVWYPFMDWTNIIVCYHIGRDERKHADNFFTGG